MRFVLTKRDLGERCRMPRLGVARKRVGRPPHLVQMLSVTAGETATRTRESWHQITLHCKGHLHGWNQDQMCHHDADVRAYATDGGDPVVQRRRG